MTKRCLFIAWCLLLTTALMAGPVTIEQARQSASAFLQKRQATGSFSHRSAGTTPQLTMATQLSGLYVFNVNSNDGFVVVSGDDCAESILGYADSGSFDPDNMPDNMRAWLQGYADEIAWAKEHGVTTANNAPLRAGESNIKTSIGPLMMSHWNQDTPFNDLCPEYTSGEKSATGCVATAMAQVMYYNQWPIDPILKAIPAYDKDFSGNAVSIPLTSDLPIISFDWDNMIDDYPYHYSGGIKVSDCTSAQGTAVAQLMYYCGTSVRMDYGESSGAVSSKTADALKEFFDYAETTVSKSRNHYTYADWIEMLYHELYEGRVMLYHGASTGGGHAFVCDGYQSEDYFHFNWGWGGSSDGYFKLSALDPNEQGIGGSSSSDGFHYLQGAVVGIQKMGGTGTVLAIDGQKPNLTLESVTLSPSSILLGETTNVTFKVTNNGTKTFDGDIYVYVYGKGIKESKTFLIEAGETKECVIPYTPSGFSGTVSILAAFPGNAAGSYYPNESKFANLTVTKGSSTASNNVDITLAIDVENREGTTSTVSVGGNSTPMYNLYGNVLRGEATLSNSTDTDYSGYFYWILNPNGEAAYVRRESVYVAANSSTTIIFEERDLDYNKKYILRAACTKNNSYAWLPYGYYVLQHGIETYTADGTSTLVIPTGNTYTAPSNALAVDVTGTGVTSITPNAQPNAVYIYSGTKPSGLDGKNVIEYSGGNYSAENITLTDNSAFYSPMDFTADNVEFNYAFTVGADGTKGWNTIMLPFDVAKVTATDPTTGETKDIDWFHSISDGGKNFWVKEFTGDESNQVYFDFTEQMKANTPYIVAFPGNKWGAAWDMSNKVIKFIGENATVHKGGTLSTITGSSYRFVGNTVQDNTENIYSLNTTGNQFVLNTTGGSAPFRAFFKPGMFDRTVSSLAIGSGYGGGTTSLDEAFSVKNEESAPAQYYNLNGQRVSQPTKGLYIVNGKKMIVK